MRLIMSALFAVLFVVAGGGSACAHAKMAASIPEDGATVPAGLTQVQLDFSKPMRVTVVRVTRMGDQASTPLKAELPSTFVMSAKLPLKPLAAGSYEVSWTAVADDGHVMNGVFKFTVTEAKSAQ